MAKAVHILIQNLSGVERMLTIEWKAFKLFMFNALFSPPLPSPPL
jgi:hypothetical protein